MAWLLIGLTVVLVVVIGLVAVGGVTQRMAALPPERVFDLDEATAWVGERLPDAQTAVLSFDDVRTVLALHLDYLEALGVAREDSVPEHGAPGEWAAEGEGPRVADDDAALAFVLGGLEQAGRHLDDDDVAVVIARGEDYLAAIGAVGAAVPHPGDLE